MANASRDNNGVTTLLGVSNADGVTLIPFVADPTTHRLQMNLGTTGTDLSSDNNARRDQNSTTVAIGTSSSDGITPVAIYADSVTSRLLAKST